MTADKILDIAIKVFALVGGTGTLAGVGNFLFSLYKARAEKRTIEVSADSVVVDSAKKANEVLLDVVEALSERVDALEVDIKAQGQELKKERDDHKKTRDSLTAQIEEIKAASDDKCSGLQAEINELTEKVKELSKLVKAKDEVISRQRHEIEQLKQGRGKMFDK